jgi:hypothetical protein
MTTILELHVSGLREANRRPSGFSRSDPMPARRRVYLDLRDSMALSSILDPALVRDKPVAMALSCARPS